MGKGSNFFEFFLWSHLPTIQGTKMLRPWRCYGRDKTVTAVTKNVTAVHPKKFVSPISLKFMGIFGWNLVGTRIGSILCHFYHFLFQIPPQKFCIKFWKKSQNRPPRRSNAPQMTKNEENAWYGPKKCPHQISLKNSQYFVLFWIFWLGEFFNIFELGVHIGTILRCFEKKW